MYNPQITASIIKKLAKSKGITLSDILSDCALGKNTIAKMSSGTDILTKNIAKIADYLNCSVDYLLGRTDCPELITLDKLNGPTVIQMPTGEKIYKIKVAARDGSGIVETTITDSDLEKINALRDVDDL